MTVELEAPGLRWRGAYAHFVAQYRRRWQMSVLTNVTEGVLYLAAMGLGLGSIVNHRHSGSLHGATYLSFIGAGIVASSAVQVGMFESTWPVLGAIKWNRIYHGMLAGPMGVLDVVLGQLAWVGTRIAMTVAIYLAAVAAFGGIPSWWALLAWPAGVLGGIAVAAPVIAYSARIENDVGFTVLFRFGFLPLFLFSGTFFPITQLPRGLQYAAYATPLWHAVSVVRDCTLGHPNHDDLVHVAYLLVLAVVGVAVATRTFRARLVR